MRKDEELQLLSASRVQVPALSVHKEQFLDTPGKLLDSCLSYNSKSCSRHTDRLHAVSEQTSEHT